MSVHCLVETVLLFCNAVVQQINCFVGFNHSAVYRMCLDIIQHTLSLKWIVNDFITSSYNSIFLFSANNKFHLM